ncbi:MAG: 50S ribosomal protein L29 [Armatimonadetes bacterium]|nr:50S ribosomal protein L29 [Armatimonadota bacterium]
MRRQVQESSDAELVRLLAETRKELFHLNLQRATKQLEKGHRIHEARKQIARILQAQGERARSREVES